MLILPDYSHAYMIESASSPIVPKYSWQFDAPMQDFMLKKIMTLEETYGTTVRVRINNFDFNIPSSWNILAVDDEALYVDTIPIIDAANNNFSVFFIGDIV